MPRMYGPADCHTDAYTQRGIGWAHGRTNGPGAAGQTEWAPSSSGRADAQILEPADDVVKDPHGDAPRGILREERLWTTY
jgi:hypothetical protein